MVVDINATDEDVVEKAKSRFQAKFDNNEFMENLVDIVEDVEIPYGL